MVQNKKNVPFVLGIGGGIGCGKSVVSRLLSFFDIPVFNSDKEAKALYEEDEVVKKFVCTHFGADLYDTSNGGLNRKRFAQILFSNPNYLRLVESFIHPLVKTRFKEWRSQQASQWVGLESAILYPSGLSSICNAIIWVEAPRDEQIKRVLLRDKASLSDVEKRIEAQKNIYPPKASTMLFLVDNSVKSALLPQLRSITEELNKKVKSTQR